MSSLTGRHPLKLGGDTLTAFLQSGYLVLCALTLLHTIYNKEEPNNPHRVNNLHNTHGG